jgi:predicted aconitase with swiveling domain
MPIKMGNNVDMQQNQLFNALLQILSSDPSTTQALVWFNSTSKRAKIYDGTTTQILAQLSDTLDTFGSPAANVSWASFKITNLATPTASTDAATKGYVDSVAVGLDVHEACQWATTTALAAGTYSGGVFTETGTLGLSVDGNTPAVADRVLVKNQGTATQNGIYVVTAVGGSGAHFVLTRAADFNTTALVQTGAFTFITGGTANAATGWILTTPAPITLDATNLTFTTFSSSSSYTNGAGITLTGSTFSANVDTTTIFTNGSSELAVNSSGTVDQVLLSGGTAGTAATWGKVSLTAGVTGILPAGNGGTGISTTPTNGQIPIGNGTDYTAAAPSAGPMIGIDVGSGTLEIDNLGPVKLNVTAVSVANIASLSAPGATLDSVSLSSGQRILLTAQTTTHQNGIWIWNGAASALTRPTDFVSASTTMAYFDQVVSVDQGTVYAGTEWRITTTGTITIDTSAIAYTQWATNLAGNGVTGTLAIANGGTGATSASTALAALGGTGKYVTAIGNASATSFVITHGLSDPVHVQVFDNVNSPNDYVLCEVQYTSSTTVTLVFSTAPTSNQYKVVCIG